MDLNAEQKAAVELATKGHLFYLTGFAGTGKSTTINTIVRRLQARFACLHIY
jgi:adenylylsulfate kinase-like enzyme